MAEQTNDLKLFKYNTATDGKEVFSIEKSMNENWDKIDAFSSAIKSLSNLDAVGEKRFTDINTALSKKLEAEVLLAENGYIKFNNGLIICFGSITTTMTHGTQYNVVLPISMDRYHVIIGGSKSIETRSLYDFDVKSRSTTAFTVMYCNQLAHQHTVYLEYICI